MDVEMAYPLEVAYDRIWEANLCGSVMDWEPTIDTHTPRRSNNLKRALDDLDDALTVEHSWPKRARHVYKIYRPIAVDARSLAKLTARSIKTTTLATLAACRAMKKTPAAVDHYLESFWSNLTIGFDREEDDMPGAWVEEEADTWVGELTADQMTAHILNPHFEDEEEHAFATSAENEVTGHAIMQEHNSNTGPSSHGSFKHEYNSTSGTSAYHNPLQPPAAYHQIARMPNIAEYLPSAPDALSDQHYYYQDDYYYTDDDDDYYSDDDYHYPAEIRPRLPLETTVRPIRSTTVPKSILKKAPDNRARRQKQVRYADQNQVFPVASIPHDVRWFYIDDFCGQEDNGIHQHPYIEWRSPATIDEDSELESVTSPTISSLNHSNENSSIVQGKCGPATQAGMDEILEKWGTAFSRPQKTPQPIALVSSSPFGKSPSPTMSPELAAEQDTHDSSSTFSSPFSSVRENLPIVTVQSAIATSNSSQAYLHADNRAGTRPKRPQTAATERTLRDLLVRFRFESSSAYVTDKRSATLSRDAKFNAAKSAATLIAKAREAESIRKEKQEREKREAEETERVKKAAAEAGAKVIRPLSNHMQLKLDNLLAVRSDSHQVTSLLTRKDFTTVCPQPWEASKLKGTWGLLNDEIVNGYIIAATSAYLEKIGHVKGSTPVVHAFNSHMYSTYIKNHDVKSVSGWLRRAKLAGISLLKTEMVFIPINAHNHWTLLVIRGKDRQIHYYDSLGDSGHPFTTFALRLVEETLGVSFNKSEWTVVVKKSAQQENGVDCGCFAALNAAALVMGKDPPVAIVAEDIPMARIQIAATLVNGGFTGEFALP